MQKIKTDRNGLAMKGYDPVSYFESSGPRQGSIDLAADWSGATWHFATAENRTRFLDNPERFAPQFGGHCAFAQLIGQNVKGSPKRWMIEDGKLFLNKNLVAQVMASVTKDRIVMRTHRP